MTPEYHAVLALLSGKLVYEEQQRHAATVRAARPPRAARSDRNRQSRRDPLSSRAGRSR
jgi:hypothetical protein